MNARGVILVLASSGCAHGATVDARLHELAVIAHRAREHGAYRCAPEELARAEAELEFARAELALGDRVRADEHVVRASANARAALAVTSTEGCREASSTSGPEAQRATAHTIRLTLAQPPLRPGSTKEHAAI